MTLEEKAGRPIFTHELADKKVVKEIQNAVKEDFKRLCKSETDQ